jgi:hypothetical protein
MIDVVKKLNTPSTILISAVIWIASACAWADTLKTEFRQYDDVYVRTGSRIYYVLVPATGEMINVDKKSVLKNGLIYTRSRNARDKIFAEWKKNRGIKRDPAPLPNKAPTPLDQLLITPEPEEVEESLPSLLTNRPEEKAKYRSSRRTFMSSTGAQLLTNNPDRFSENTEYVEVLVDYEMIEIPNEFKHTAPPGTPVSVDSLEQVVDHYAKQYRLDKHLIYAVIQAESSGNPYAVSPAGARGLMQLMPGTAAEMGVEDIFDPVENIAGGTQYLNKMSSMWNGDKLKILASYNAGPGNVKKYGGVPPFKETEDFIRRVLQFERQYKRKGVPTYTLADIKPVEKGYLPPVSEPYYQFVMNNGLTVRAESIQDRDDYYQYVYGERSGRIRKDQIQRVIDPA